ncbi:MAG: hypothetical protein LBB22_00965 [Treponema sp.]|jgi:hypothetical protein|nr:hypothetical protein [Treponema sp.]
MGISKNSLLGMRYAAANGVEFKNSLMVGRQSLLVEKNDIMKILGTTWGGGGICMRR